MMKKLICGVSVFLFAVVVGAGYASAQMMKDKNPMVGGAAMYKTKNFEIFAGPIAPGNHNLQVVATYRGHGYVVFEYLTKFTFTARGNASFTTGEGKISKVECKGFEKGGAATPMEKRPAIECKVSEVQPEKPAETKPSTNPGTTPLPPPAAPNPAPTTPAK